jgi:hypothetical protein
MALQFVPYTERAAPAVRAFNQRMSGARAPTEFLLPEGARAASGALEPLARTQYLAIDGDTVRGGVAVVEQPTWVNGRVVATHNYQAPLSEGIVDRRYSFVGLQMLKHLEQRRPLAFAVGMGSDQNALPRLLKALGWTVRPVPFMFRVANVARVLAELSPLRSSRWRRVAARLATASRAAWLGVELCQARARLARSRVRRIGVEPIGWWGSWADALWEPRRFPYSLAVIRDRRTLKSLYPLHDDRVLAFVVREGSEPVGWAACLNTEMSGHKDFGNLRVATVLDAVARPEWLATVAAGVSDALTAAGADLLITNQSHASWADAFRRAGFLRGPSNYLLATSRALTEEVCRGGGEAVVHVTRGDADGRIHL